MRILMIIIIAILVPFMLLSQEWIDNHWVLSNYVVAGTALRDVAEVNPYGILTGWVVGDQGKVYKLQYESVVNSFVLDDNYNLYGVSFVEPGNNGWICGNNILEEEGILYITNDGGNNWTSYPIKVGENVLAAYDVVFWDSNLGYLACSDGYVLKSTNGGVNWTPTHERPFLDDDTTICITHVEITADDDIWCVGDNMGVLAHSTDGGFSWGRLDPFNYTYQDLPDPGQTYEGKLAKFGIYPISQTDCFDGMSHGTYAWTTDGGSHWYKPDPIAEPQWVYSTGIRMGLDKTLFGSSGNIYTFSNFGDLPPVDYYTKDYDVYGCCTGTDWLHYAAGGSEAILYHSDWGQGIPSLYCYITGLELIPPAPNYTDRVTVKWTAHNETASQKQGTFHVYLSFCAEGPFFEIHTEPYNIPAGGVVNRQWDDDVFPEPPHTLDNLPRYYYVDMYPGTRIYGDLMVFTIGEEIFPTPSEIPTFYAQDAAVDQGWATNLNWTCNVQSQIFHIYKSPKRTSERYGLLGTTANYTLNDNLALTGYEFEYSIRRNMYYDGELVAFSDPEICYGHSEDETRPDQVTYSGYSFNPQDHTLYIRWYPLEDSTLGGYWVCPTTAEKRQTHSLSQVAPILRNWYKDYYIYWETGQDGLVAVCAMDRSCNIGDWNDKYIHVPLATATRLDATYANNGKRLQVDGFGYYHLVFTSDETPSSIYYSKSTDNGAHWTKEHVASFGRFPAMVIKDNVLHMVWIQDIGTVESIMYSKKNASDQSFSEPIELFSTTMDPNIKSLGPPAIAVSQNKACVTWEGRQILGYRYELLYYGEFPVGDPSSFDYGPLDIGSAIHRICFSPVMDTITEPECPSIAIDKAGNSYIAWDKIDLNSHFYDIVIWSNESGIWLNEVISNTDDCTDEKEAYITYENGILHCVWSGTEDNGGLPFNIYHSKKYPGQANGGWEEPEMVNSSILSSFSPVFEKGYAIWNEGNRNIVTRRYSFDDFDWHTAPVETVAKDTFSVVPEYGLNKNPIATSTPDTLLISWSQQDKFSNFYVQYDEKPILHVPHYASNLGGEEPSAFTIERDGFIVYGEEYYMSMDYDSSELVYNVQGLEAKPNQDLELMFYHEFNDAMKLSIRVDDSWTRNIWVSPGEPVSIEGMIPVACLQDGEIDITIEPIAPTQDALAVCSALWLYDYEGGGGPMSAGTGATPLKYSLTTPSPSPFKDKTTICYSITKPGMVSLKVYDQTGRLVKTLQNGIKEVGNYSVKWNGTDNNNRKVSAGVYFTRLMSGDFESVKKLVLVR